MRSVVLFWVLTHLVPKCHGRGLPQPRYFHTNVCSHIVPEPTVYLNNMFDTQDYFFPSYFTERRCRSPKTSSGQPAWHTCLNGQYHCVTRYRRMEFLRTPNPNNVTFRNASTEMVRVPVACECSSYIVIWAWQPSKKSWISLRNRTASSKVILVFCWMWMSHELQINPRAWTERHSLDKSKLVRTWFLLAL